MNMEQFPTAPQVDVLLLLEGTFPFVRGGVSSWVNQIITGFPHLEFGAVFIGSRADDYTELKYELPPNLKHLRTYFLHGSATTPPVVRSAGNSQGFEVIRHLHSWFVNSQQDAMIPKMKELAFYLHAEQGVDYSQFLYSEQSWEYISELYRQRCTDPSFVDYFWTVRTMHGPIWQLASIAAETIPAKMYHSVSTGYAGFLGAILHHHSSRPLLLSEHGIYTKERRIDLLNSDWIRDNRNALQRNPTEVSYYRELWIRFFETLGRFCYDAADQIVSLYGGIQKRQIDDGAVPAKIQVIPNGIDLARFSPLRDTRPAGTPLIVALLGRVVPIKDVKTFIRAIRVLSIDLPELEGWIVGPQEEDPEYAAECHDLAQSLEIGHLIKFTGFMDPVELFPRIGLLALSSISEGLPLVALEGFAAGVPLVATDVGACRQLVEGLGDEDRALGSAGGIVPINAPQAFADACQRLLTEPLLWKAAQTAAIARVEAYYTQQQMFERYRALYQEGLS
jgi:glycosyltransferase involved in cell wall biosynthesis